MKKTLQHYIKKSLGLLFIALFIFIAIILLDSNDEEPILSVKDSLTRVSVINAQAKAHDISLSSQGRIDARWRSTLTSEVGGEVLFISPKALVGGKFSKGDILLSIDDTQYRSDVAAAESALAQAQQELAEEKQQAERAEQNWLASKLPGKPSDSLLRKPQLNTIRKRIAAAKYSLKNSQKKLAKTKIIAPYNGITITRNINLGDYLIEENPVIEIYAYDQLQVRLPITQDQAKLLTEDSIKVTITSPDDQQQWGATITRRDNVIDPKNQSLHVIAELSPQDCLLYTSPSPRDRG